MKELINDLEIKAEKADSNKKLQWEKTLMHARNTLKFIEKTAYIMVRK